MYCRKCGKYDIYGPMMENGYHTCSSCEEKEEFKTLIGMSLTAITIISFVAYKLFQEFGTIA